MNHLQVTLILELSLLIEYVKLGAALMCCSLTTLHQSCEEPHWGFLHWGLRTALKLRALLSVLSWAMWQVHLHLALYFATPACWLDFPELITRTNQAITALVDDPSCHQQSSTALLTQVMWDWITGLRGYCCGCLAITLSSWHSYSMAQPALALADTCLRSRGESDLQQKPDNCLPWKGIHLAASGKDVHSSLKKIISRKIREKTKLEDFPPNEESKSHSLHARRGSPESKGRLNPEGRTGTMCLNYVEKDSRKKNGNINKEN